MAGAMTPREDAEVQAAVAPQAARKQQANSKALPAREGEPELRAGRPVVVELPEQ